MFCTEFHTLGSQALCYLCLHTTFLPGVSPALFTLRDLDRADTDRTTAPESSGSVPTGTSGGDSLQADGASSLRRRMFPDDFVIELHFDEDVAAGVAAAGSELFRPSSSKSAQMEKGHQVSLDAECYKCTGSFASTESCYSAELSPLDQLRSMERLSCGRAASSESLELESEVLCGGRQTGAASSAGRRQGLYRSQPRVDLEDHNEPTGGASSEEDESFSPETTKLRSRRFPSVVVAVADSPGTRARGGSMLASRALSAAAALQASFSGTRGKRQRDDVNRL